MVTRPTLPLFIRRAIPSHIPSGPRAAWFPLALWLASMVLPGPHVPFDDMPGFLWALYSLFPMFWIFVWPFFLGALPNILMLAGTLMMFTRHYRAAAVCGAIAFAGSVTAGTLGRLLWADEEGLDWWEIELGIGYWVWSASYFALLLLAVFLGIRAKRDPYWSGT